VCPRVCIKTGPETVSYFCCCCSRLRISAIVLIDFDDFDNSLCIVIFSTSASSAGAEAGMGRDKVLFSVIRGFISGLSCNSLSWRKWGYFKICSISSFTSGRGGFGGFARLQQQEQIASCVPELPGEQQEGVHRVRIALANVVLQQK